MTFEGIMLAIGEFIAEHAEIGLAFCIGALVGMLFAGWLVTAHYHKNTGKTWIESINDCGILHIDIEETTDEK